LDPIPESWPPESDSSVLPVFPLPRVWLVPYMVLPLHVFEERYKQMVEDCLDGPGRIVVATVVEDEEHAMAGSPGFHPVAGLGEIGRHEKLPDGRFNIVLVGLQRVRAREVESERLYRKVEVEPAAEIDVPREREVELRERLVEAITERADEKPMRLSPQIPAAHLADLLILRLPLPHGVLNGLYAELDAEKRAEGALAEHARRPR
jgi:Lon protease-like protein